MYARVKTGVLAIAALGTGKKKIGWAGLGTVDTYSTIHIELQGPCQTIKLFL
jgi:hypothetical protein